MGKATRLIVMLGLLVLALSCSALAGALPVGPLSAAAADEETGETTTPEEPPPVENPPPVETPTETTPPPTETPTTTPAETSPPSTGTTPSEPKAPTSSGTEASAGGGGGSSNGGSGSTATTTTGTSTSPTRSSQHVRTSPSRSNGGNAGNDSGGGTRHSGGSKPASGGGNDSGGGGRHPSGDSGGSVRHHQPSVSPQGFEEGASAVSNAAAHVGEVFAEAVPTAPLKKIGDRLAAHIGLSSKRAGKGGKADAEGIGTALGAALIGSAVAVEKPAPSHSPLSAVDLPGGESGTIYVVLIVAVLLALAVLVVRELRSALAPKTLPRGAPVIAAERPSLRERVGEALAGVLALGEGGVRAFRRMSASAVSGVRSLF